MKTLHCKFREEKNRGHVDLLVLIIDFDSTKNCDLFIANFCKFLIVNKFEEDKELNFVNFYSTYDKSLRLHRNVTCQLFELILERNEKRITGGALGFKDRLEIFFNRCREALTNFRPISKKQ